MNSLDIQKWRNKYIYQINESNEEDFNVEDVPEHWNEVELGTGDIITPEMMGISRTSLMGNDGNSYYKIGEFDPVGQKVTIYKGTMLHRPTGDVFVPNNSYGLNTTIRIVQNKLLKGYRLNPNKITLSELLGY